MIDSTISVVPGTLARAVDAFMGTTFASSSFSTSSSNNGELASTTFEAAGELEATPLLGDDVREAPRRGDVGLVHHVPYAVVHEGTVGSMVEMAFLNSTHAKMYLAIVSSPLIISAIWKRNKVETRQQHERRQR